MIKSEELISEKMTGGGRTKSRKASFPCHEQKAHKLLPSEQQYPGLVPDEIPPLPKSERGSERDVAYIVI